jgi:hypothetical protein
MSNSTPVYNVSGQQTEYMYKKTLGVGYEQPGFPPSQEKISSLPYIFNNQIMSNNIPPTAPPLDVSSGISGGGTQWTTDSSYVYFYEYLPLTINVNSSNFSFGYASNQNNNLTTHSIPSTYEPTGSYILKIYSRLTGTTNYQEVVSSSNMSWIFDTATGYVTFTTASWNSIYSNSAGYDEYPYISFYRYEGAFGAGSGGGGVWSSSGSNIYYNDGNVGIGTSSPSYTLDVSGSTRINNNNVNVGGNTYIYTPYSVGAPLAPQILTDLTSNTNSTSITFTWTIPNNSNNPNNISTSIQNISATLYANISGTIKTYQILNNNTTNLTSLNTIIVTNQSSITGPSSGFLNNSTTTYTYYSSDFSNMQDSSSNQLILWYSNFSPYPNVSYIGYSKFTATGVPSSVSFNPSSQSSYNNITLQCYVTLTDTSNGLTGPPYITNYKIPSSGYSTTGSTRRYPGPYSDSGGNLVFTGNNSSAGSSNAQPFPITLVYPDCSYNFNVQASNDGGTNYGPTGSYNIKTIAPTYPTTTTPSSLFSLGSGVTGYANQNASSFNLVSNNNVINTNTTPIINVNYVNNWTSNPIITPVQTSLNYGATGSNFLDISCNISHNSNNITPILSVGGFNTTSSYSNTSSNIQLIANTYDYYPSTQPYNQGFYLDCSTNSIITSSYFTPFQENNSLYNIVLTTRQKQNTGTNNTYSSSYSFYADDLSLNPKFISINSFNLNSTSNYYSTQISGIWVISQNPVFTVNGLKISNMGDYFYASPLVSYSMTGGCSTTSKETSNSNITNITSGKFGNPIDISNNNISGTIQTAQRYSNVILSLSQINSIYGSSSQSNIKTINVITDYPSYNLITNLLSSSIQQVGTSSTNSTPGYRVWSANVDSGIPGGGTTTMTPSGLAPYPYVVNGTSVPNGTATGSTPSGLNQGYVDVSYNNIWDISNNTLTNQELLIANGGFTTNNTYYSNYGSISSANGNTFDYTGLASTGNNGKKYSTFVWNVNSYQSNIYFQIQFTSALTSYQNFYYLDTNNPPQQQLELYYRFEYTNDVTTNSWGQIGTSGTYYPNTTWISINSITTGSSGVSTGTICSSSNITNIYYMQPTTVTSSNNLYTFKAQSPVLNINNDARLYLRIGMPNNVTNNSFSSVKCYYSA